MILIYNDTAEKINILITLVISSLFQLSSYPSIHSSIYANYPVIQLSLFFQFIHLSIYQLTHLSIYPFILLPNYTFIHLSIYPLKNPLYLTKNLKNIYFKINKKKCTCLIIYLNSWQVRCKPLVFCNLFFVFVCLTNYITISEQIMSDYGDYILTDKEVEEMVRESAVRRYNLTGDVDQLTEDVFFPGTEDMEVDDSQGIEEGNGPDDQNFGNLAAPGKGSGQSGSDGLRNYGSEVIDTSEQMDDAEMEQVRLLRKLALKSRLTKTLASGGELGENAKRSKKSEPQSSKNNKGHFSTSTLPDSSWVGGYQRRMDQNFRNAVDRLRAQVSNELVNPPPLLVADTPVKSTGFQGVIQKADRKKSQSSDLTLIVGGDGSVGLREKPVDMNLTGLPPFTGTLANTAAVVTTNCVKSQSEKLYFPKGSSAYYTMSIKPNDSTWTSRGNIKLRTDQPWLWIVGDQSVPEILEGPTGKVVGISRVEDATFDNLRTLLRTTLPNKRPHCFPAGSVILVSAPVELLRLDVSAFLVLYNDFEKWLCGRLHSAKDPDTFIFKEGEVELSEYVVIPIFPPTNDEILLPRIAQVNHNTKLKFAKFPAPQTQFVDYQKVLGCPRTAEATGMKTIAREFGSLPVLAPNFSSTKGIAISSSYTAQVPTGAPYILDAQQRSPEYFPWLLDILGELRSDLNIPDGKNLNQGQIPLKKFSSVPLKIHKPSLLFLPASKCINI